MRTFFRISVVSLFLFLPLVLAMAAEAGQGRFFLAGDGKIHIRNVRNAKEARVELLHPDGSFNEEAFTAIDEVFGFPTRDKGEHISPRLIFMMDYFSDLAAPGKPIQLTWSLSAARTVAASGTMGVPRSTWTRQGPGSGRPPPPRRKRG